jgi:hypothetical protein
METAKVDIRKLQLLNDRINQVIDALHQVRLSVHALQQGYQTQPQPYGAGFGTQAFGQTFNPLFQQSPFQQTPFQQTPFQQNPFQFQSPFQQGFGQGMNPMHPMAQMHPMQTPGGGATPGLLHSGTPWPGGQGLSHTGSEQDLFGYNRPLWSDPNLAARLSTTFPYAHYPVPPVVTLY